MQRRTLFTLATASTLAATAVTGGALAADNTGPGSDLNGALRRFLALPGTKSYLIHVGSGGSLGQIAHHPNSFLFTASAYKTFVLGQYLRDVEVGRPRLGHGRLLVALKILASEDPLTSMGPRRRSASCPMRSTLGHRPGSQSQEAFGGHHRCPRSLHTRAALPATNAG